MKILKAQALASKQYISIIRLFNHCAIDFDNELHLSRAKKQLHAEFRVAKDGIIEIDGFSYTQQDVMQELEQPDFLKRFVYHKRIWESPELLRLLEQNTVDLTTIGEAFQPFWSNKEFDYFFSPYFVGPFSYLSRSFLSERRLKDMGSLLAYEGFLQPAEQEEALRPIRLFLDESIRLLRNVNKENYKIMRPKIAHWIDEEWFQFFNFLPEDFYDIKLEIVTKLINIGVSVQKTHRRDCRKVSGQLISLTEMPDALRNIILSNHDAYTGSRRSISVGQGWWAIWLVFILIRAIACESCESSSSNSYKNFEFKITDSSLIRLRDSVVNTRKIPLLQKR